MNAVTPTDVRFAALERVEEKLMAQAAAEPKQCPVSGEEFQPAWADRKRPTVKTPGEVVILKTADSAFWQLVAAAKSEIWQEQADAERTAAEAANAARRAARGSLEDFIAARWKLEDKDEARFASALSKAVSAKVRGEQVIEKLKQGLDGDPMYALGWGKDAFDAAGSVTAARDLIAHFEAGATYAGVSDYFVREVIRMARNPGRSTSPTSNLSEQSKLAAYAEVAEDLRSGW